MNPHSLVHAYLCFLFKLIVPVELPGASSRILNMEHFFSKSQFLEFHHRFSFTIQSRSLLTFDYLNLLVLLMSGNIPASGLRRFDLGIIFTVFLCDGELLCGLRE